MKKLLMLLFLMLPLFAFAESDFYYNNGKKITINSSQKFISFKTKILMTKEAVQKELLNINNIPKALEIKVASNNRFIVKFADKIENIDKVKVILSKLSFVSEILPAYTFDDEKWPLVLDDKIFVNFKDDVSEKEIMSVLNKYEMKILQKYVFDKNFYLLQTNQQTLNTANTLYESGIFKFSEPAFLKMFVKKFTPDDTYFAKQWHHAAGTGGVKSQAAWDINRGSSSIKIAIIDDGIKVGHEDLNLILSKDFSGENNLELGGDHGTACAGVAAAIGNNGKGMSGMCPNCSLLAGKIMRSDGGYPDEDSDVNAFNWAIINNADVVSCSWGYGQDMQIPSYLNTAINGMATNGRDGKGAVIVFASGNDNREFSSNSLEGHPKIISVGATTYQDVRTSYSNYGSTLDVVAPSSTGYYDLSNDKDGIWTTDAYGTANTRGYNLGGSCIMDGYNLGQDVDTAGRYTKTFGGTSSACPLVSGLAGLILSEDSTLTYAEVYTIITTTADKIGTGYVNGHSDYLGYGRINASRALTLAHNGSTCTPDPNGENCTNGVDDDCDLAIDSADTDCGTNCSTDCSSLPHTHCDVDANGEEGCYCDDGYVVNAEQTACVIDSWVDDTLNNNTPATAKAITTSTYTVTSHSCTNKHDFFKFNLALNSTVTVTVNNFSNDIDVYLLNSATIAEESVVASAATENTTETFSYTATAALTYYVMVSPYQTVDSNYTLTVQIDGTVVNPCDNVTCSNHGTCVNANGVASCTCDTGYHAVGLTCVVNTTNPCDGVTCSGYGTCVNTNGVASCSCIIGFHPVGLTCVEDNVINPCDGVTCSGYGVCVDVNGTASCSCNAGYHSSGLSCVPDVVENPCSGVTSCDAHGYCVVDNNAAMCVCIAGYHAEGLTCAENDVTNPCDGVTCSGYGICTITNNQPYCQCREGYESSGLNCLKSFEPIGGGSSSGCNYSNENNNTILLILLSLISLFVLRKKYSK